MERQSWARAEAARNEAVRTQIGLLDFVLRVFPRYQATPLHRFLAERLEAFLLAVEREEAPRLVLTVPPRHGKSQIASIGLLAYALGRNPDWPVIHTSYTADLSNDFSRQVRNLLREPEYQAIFPGILPAPDSSSVQRWGMRGRRGVFISSGIGGPLTGRGAQLVVIDDPVKNSEDADSEVFRAHQRSWYSTTLRTRLEKGAGILLILTRWHVEDLAGYVTTGAGTDEPPGEEWETLTLPALAGENDPLGRAPGEPLWPEKYNREALAAMERQMTPRWWMALMQGGPVAAEGNLLKVNKIEHGTPPDGARFYQAWDLAISEKTTADWTVGMTIAVDEAKNVYLVDEARGRWSFNEVLEQIAAAAAVWDPVSIGIESTAFQAAVFQEASRRYMLPFREVKCDRDKVVRAQLLADRIEAGQVFANKRAPWWRGWETEARDFPQGGHDDRCDATAHCVRMVSILGWTEDQGTIDALIAKMRS